MCVFALNDCKTPEGVLVNILMEKSHDVSVSLQLSGGCELTVVLHDFSAGCSTELSVCTGEGKKDSLFNGDVIKQTDALTIHCSLPQARRSSC